MKTTLSAVRRLAYVFGLACAGVAAVASAAQQKVQLGVPPIGDYIAVYVAYDEGIYAKHGLDVTLHPIGISSLTTAGLLSKSLDVAALSVPDTIQAVDSGIDLVTFAGLGVLAAETEGGTRVGVVAPPDSRIESAADYKGKTVGVPALGGLLHIMFQHYLGQNGVSYEDVTFIELAVPSHFDAIKSASVDAVVTVDPMLVRLVNTKAGKQVVSLNGTVPPKTLTSIIASTRDYAQQNPQVVEAMRKALDEATELSITDHEKTRAAMVKYLKLPAPVAATIDMPLTLETGISVEQMNWWRDVMREQKLIDGRTDLGKTILP